MAAKFPGLTPSEANALTDQKYRESLSQKVEWDPNNPLHSQKFSFNAALRGFSPKKGGVQSSPMGTSLMKGRKSQRNLLKEADLPADYQQRVEYQGSASTLHPVSSAEDIEARSMHTSPHLPDLRVEDTSSFFDTGGDVSGRSVSVSMEASGSSLGTTSGQGGA
eukprot:Rmarinus@m.28414